MFPPTSNGQIYRVEKNMRTKRTYLKGWKYLKHYCSCRQLPHLFKNNKMLKYLASAFRAFRHPPTNTATFCSISVHVRMQKLVEDQFSKIEIKFIYPKDIITEDIITTLFDNNGHHAPT